MNQSDLKIYQHIGEIHTAVALASTFQDALREGLKVILKTKLADYAVVWYAKGPERAVFSPYYWICPVDMTFREYALGEGVIGRVCRSGRSEYLRDFKKNPDSDIRQDLAGLDVTGVLCIPFHTDGAGSGCIELIRTNGVFSDDDTEACEMLALFTSITVNEGAPLPENREARKVLLSVRNMEKSFQNGESMMKVLNGVNFDVYEGEFLCLLGESGCGKSTVLNIIGGMLNADSGSVKFRGQEIVGMSQEQLTRHRRDNIGYIFQSYNLMPNLTAKQNLDLIGELVPEAMDSSQALELVGLRGKERYYPSQLSGGQQQRVAIARSFVKHPRMILADEPTAALDYSTGIEVLSVLEEVVRRGTTLVMVTHNEEITRMADRVIRFRNGQAYETTVNMHPVHATELVW